jgi:hypothetical protein
MPIADFIDTAVSAGVPLACDLSATDDPEAHGRRTKALLAEREEMRSIEGGLAFRFPATTAVAQRVLEFVEIERRCCPFLTFEIIFEPEGRALWLALGGDERVEAFVRSEFGGGA